MVISIGRAHSQIPCAVKRNLEQMAGGCDAKPTNVLVLLTILKGFKIGFILTVCLWQKRPVNAVEGLQAVCRG